jgi:phosphatidylglycerol lysyltransferase
VETLSVQPGVERVTALVAAHGWNATAPQVLGGGYRYWHAAGGCVAYVDTGGAWVAAGAPIGASDDLAELAAGFVEAAAEAGRRAMFFGTEERFVERVSGRHLVVAQQPEWDPGAWDTTLRAHRSLREQLRRARAKGVRVRTVSAVELAGDATLPPANEHTRAPGLRGRRRAPKGFLVELATPGADVRVWVCAGRAGVLIAAASGAATPARGGTLVEHVVRRREAPTGSSETLVAAAMRLAAARGDRWLTVGLAPLAGELVWPLRAARWLGRPLYNFAGLHATRARMHPARWTPIHLSVPDDASLVLGVVDALAAFARGSFVRFGLATLRQVVRARP